MAWRPQGKVHILLPAFRLREMGRSDFTSAWVNGYLVLGGVRHDLDGRDASLR